MLEINGKFFNLDKLIYYEIIDRFEDIYNSLSDKDQTLVSSLEYELKILILESKDIEKINKEYNKNDNGDSDGIKNLINIKFYNKIYKLNLNNYYYERDKILIDVMKIQYNILIHRIKFVFENDIIEYMKFETKHKMNLYIQNYLNN